MVKVGNCVSVQEVGVIESIVKFDKGGKRVTRKGWFSGVVVMVVVW